MTSIYTKYAPFYDRSGQMRFAILVFQYLQDLLGQHAVSGRRALDLACGTGTLALLLADAGWQVVGLDSSTAMLDLAREKTVAQPPTLRPQFVQADLRSFLAEPGALPGLQPASFDLVTCFYDSLNYLQTEQELAACFANVALAVAPGGLFVADMNTQHFLEHDWEPVIVQESAHFVHVQQSQFDQATTSSTMVLTGFVGDDERGYERFDEVHVERAYPVETVMQLLAASGLVVEAVYDCFTRQPPYPTSQRIAWLARRAAV